MSVLGRVTIAVLCSIPVLLTAQSPAEQAVLQLARDWCTASMNKDAAVFGRILADDYVGITSRGLIETKADALANLADKTSTLSSCVDKEMRARVYGDTAVVTGLGSRTGTFKGTAFQDRQNLWTDVFVRKDGRWQCVSSQSTLAAAQQK